MSESLSYDNYIKTAKHHKLTVKKDDGLYRHLVMSKGSFDRYFEVISWPGYLAIVGDMGSLTFSRNEDMFAFFRPHDAQNPSINCGYWEEKLQAVDKQSPPKKYCSDVFIEVIKEELASWHFDEGCDKARMDEMMEEANAVSEYEHEAREWLEDNEGHPFTDMWEHDFTEYTGGYKWLLWGIVHAIMAYDVYKE